MSSYLQSDLFTLLHRIEPRQSVRIGVWILLWSGIGVLLALHWGVSIASLQTPDWPRVLGESVVNWLIWGCIIAPLVLRIGYLSHPHRVARWRSVALPLAATPVLVGLHLVLISFVRYLSLGGTVSYADLLLSFNLYRGVFLIAACACLIVAEWAAGYFEQARQRQESERRLQDELTATQLELLKSQVEPHFLYNTLNSISSLVLCGQQDDAAAAIARLGEFMRLSLDAPSNGLVSLAGELEHVDLYFSIAKLRFGDRMAVVRRLDSDVAAVQVPSLLLLPLVENSITHGISRLQAPGRVELIIDRNGDNVVFTLVNSVAPDTPGSNGHGRGLQLTRARLERTYGDRFNLTAGRTDGNLFALRLEIPAVANGGSSV